MKDVILKHLSTAYNVGFEDLAENLFQNSDEGAEILTENALAYLNGLHATHVSNVKAASTKSFDDGYKKGEAQVRTKVEKQLREKFSIQEPLEGDELIAAIVAAKTDLPDTEKIKLSPEYLSIERELNKKVADFEAEKVAIVEQFKQQQKAEQVQKLGFETAKQLALSLNPVLPANPSIAERNLQTNLSAILSGIEYNLDEAGNIASLLKEGKRLENAHGHAYTLESLLKEQLPNYYELRVQEDKRNGGNSNTPPDPTKFAKGQGPKTEEEYQKAIQGTKTIQELALIAEQYETNLRQ